MNMVYNSIKIIILLNFSFVFSFAKAEIETDQTLKDYGNCFGFLIIQKNEYIRKFDVPYMSNYYEEKISEFTIFSTKNHKKINDYSNYSKRYSSQYFTYVDLPTKEDELNIIIRSGLYSCHDIGFDVGIGSLKYTEAENKDEFILKKRAGL